MRILLTGAGGQLGTELARQLAGTDWDVTARTRGELDITIAQEVYDAFASKAFDLVINAAAYSAVDRAEVEEERAFSVNAEGPARLARACATWNAALFHFSTDYVFDGSKQGPYKETDPPCPANAYGRTKETGEHVIRDSLDRHLIIRTAWLFGTNGQNFVKTMLRHAVEREELRVVADQCGNPTAARDLARCVVQLAQKLEQCAKGDFPWGTYHCVNREPVSWYTFAQAIIDYAAPLIGRKPVVCPLSTADYPMPAKRPLNSQLDCTRLQHQFRIVMPHWRPALYQVIDELATIQTHDFARGTP